MRTQDECLVMAAQLRSKADNCAAIEYKERFLEIARSWDDLARQAHWQDDFEKIFQLGPRVGLGN